MNRYVASGPVAVLARADDEAMLDPEVVAGNAETSFDFWSGRSLDLDRQTRSTTLFEQEIDLGSIGRTVEERSRCRAGRCDQHLDHETFPTRPDDRMTQQLVEATDLQKGMDEPLSRT